MVKVEGFLYGHYDSRGGTAMIVADDRQKADRCYDMDVAGYGEADIEEFGSMAKADFMCPVTLHLPEEIELNGCDLEDELGRVICKGLRELSDWPAWLDDEWQSGDDFMDELLKGNHQDLEFVPRGKDPVLLADSWSWPSWNDDAFSFFVRVAK